MEFDFYKVLKDAKIQGDRILRAMQDNQPVDDSPEATKEAADNIVLQADLSPVQGPTPMFKTREEAVAASANDAIIKVKHLEAKIINKMDIE